METKITLEEAYNLACSFEARTQVIGIQKEKVLHKTLKYYICPDDTKHEVKITKENKGNLYADILLDNVIFEIQTRSFNALRNKLNEFLKKYHVIIVYPIAYHKQIINLSEDNTILSSKKSPKKGNPLEIFVELYKIKNFLKNDNLGFKIILLDMDEYRKLTIKKHYRSSGYIRIVQIPKRIEREINLIDKNDYNKLLVDYNLNKTFTSTDFSKITKLNVKKSRVVLNVLSYLEVVTRVGKKGNSHIYEIKNGAVKN